MRCSFSFNYIFIEYIIATKFDLLCFAQLLACYISRINSDSLNSN